MADGENQTFPSVDAFMEARREKKEAAAEPKADTPAPQPEEDTPAPADAPQEDEIEAADPAAKTLEEEPDEANLEGDDGEEGEPKPAFDPPQFWDAEEKAAFAKLPKEAQQAVLKLEQQRNAFVSRKVNEATQVAKAAQAKQQQLTQHIEKLSGFVSEVDTELAEYGKIDWAQEIAEATTADEIKNVQWHQARFEKLKQQRAEAEKAQAQAQQAELVEFHTEQRAKLKQISPELDPDTKEGLQRVTYLSKFLEANGIDVATQTWMPAEGMALAYDAMRFRLLQQQNGKQTPQPTPKPPAGPTVRPASSPSGSSVTQRLQQLQNKKTLSQEEFIEKRKLERKSKRK